MTYDEKHDVPADQETTGRTVVGLFARKGDAEADIRDLKATGFRDDQIGVALQDKEEQGELLESTGAKEAQGAAVGALSGGLVGGLIGLLGSLLVPGVGPIIVGGVLASTLTGAGIGAATGGIIGVLVSMSLPHCPRCTCHGCTPPGEALAISTWACTCAVSFGLGAIHPVPRT